MKLDVFGGDEVFIVFEGKIEFGLIFEIVSGNMVNVELNSISVTFV